MLSCHSQSGGGSLDAANAYLYAPLSSNERMNVAVRRSQTLQNPSRSVKGGASKILQQLRSINVGAEEQPSVLCDVQITNSEQLGLIGLKEKSIIMTVQRSQMMKKYEYIHL